MDAGAPGAPCRSSIPFGSSRWEGRPPPRTSRCAAGATINTRPSWSLALAPGASRATPEFRRRVVTTVGSVPPSPLRLVVPHERLVVEAVDLRLHGRHVGSQDE